MALETEIRYFESQRLEFLREHEGKFALIKGDAVFGFFDDAISAYRSGTSQFGFSRS